MHFRTGGLPDAEAFAHWRQLMAPLFTIAQARYTSALPRGNLSIFHVGGIMANRCTFNAQHLTRDPALIAATPDHLVLQYYKSGGFRGAIAGHPVCIVRGQVAVADLSREVDAYAASSDTIGLSVPRALLAGIDPQALTRQLDAPRNALLGGFMAGLPRRLAVMRVGDVPALIAELVKILTRVFAPGPLDIDAAPGVAVEALLARAVGLIEARLGTPDLTPARLAEQLGVSRAALYRLFVPMGGVMRYVQERRLLALREVLGDPLDRRPMAQIAATLGFSSQAVMSRSFRTRFGATPRAWRRERTELDLATRETSHDQAHERWQDLGRNASRK